MTQTDMRPIVNFWEEYGFGDVEFRNVRLLDSGIFAVLDRLGNPGAFTVDSNPGRTLIHVWWSVFLIRFEDETGFESAKTEFPSDTEILQDGSLLPRYFGEFEKDGKKYVIVDCEEKLADADKSGNWVEGTYRNLVFDRRKDTDRVAYGVKKSAQDALNSSTDTK